MAEEWLEAELRAACSKQAPKVRTQEKSEAAAAKEFLAAPAVRK